MGTCTICREALVPSEPTAGDASLCPSCALLFKWFLDHYADVEFQTEGWLTPRTTFHELNIESLDYVEWLHEAEKEFGVAIPEPDAERMRSVEDYLRFIRFSREPTPEDQGRKRE